MNTITEECFGVRATLGKNMLSGKALGFTGLRRNRLRKLGD